MARKTKAEVQAILGKMFPGAQAKALSELFDALNGDMDAVEADVTDVTTTADNLNTWAIALATKLNADAGVTDTNYDIDPQA